jgi:hypothetical protein
MAGFPLTDPRRFPVPLGELLARLGDRGHLAHLSVAKTSDGNWQASCKAEYGKAYSVAIKDDMIQAILEAVGPGYNGEWVDLLGAEYRETFGIEDPEEDDDDLEDVLG